MAPPNGAPPTVVTAPIEDPLRALGGGDGASTNCTTRPWASQAELDAIAVALEAARNPAPSSPAVVGGGSGSGITDISQINLPWFAVRGGVPHVMHWITCGDTVSSGWIPVTISATTITPQPRPEDIVPGLWRRIVRQLPAPRPAIAPADWHPNGWAYVNVSTFFWVAQEPGQWATVPAEAAVPGLSVRAWAEPVRFVVHPGDGSPAVICEGAPPAFRRDYDHPETFQGCEHTYVDSSAMAANGETFPLRVEIVWHGQWQASNGQSGDLGYVSTVSAVRDLGVAEIQAVIVDSD